MEKLGLSVDQVLTTTRAVRKRLDLTRPVEMSLIKDCLEQALQAPVGGNAPRIRFVVVTDTEKRKEIADVYRRFYQDYRTAAPKAHEANPEIERLWASTDHLAEILHEVPVLVIPCWPRPKILPKMPAYSSGSSVYPAVWSYMLAARERGLGTCMTTGHLTYEAEAAKVLNIPYDTVAQYCLIPTAYTIGKDFKPAKRSAIDQFIHLDGWRD